MTQRGHSHDAADPDEVVFDLDDPAPGPSARRSPAQDRSGPGRGGVDVEEPDGGAPGGRGSEGGGSEGGGPRSGGRWRGLASRPWPQGAPAWVRGPAAAVAVAVLAAAAGGAFGTHQQRASLDEELAVERVLGGFDVGDPFVVPSRFDATGQPFVGADGVMDVQLGFTVTNTSRTPAAVRVRGVEVAGTGDDESARPRLTVLGAAAPLRLDALDSGTAELEAEVDCATAPFDEAEHPPSRPDWVTASVGVDGEEHEVRWGTRTDRGSLAQQLASACHTSRSPNVVVSSVELLEDGRLRVDIDNAGSVAAAVGVVTSGAEVLGDPGLPLALAAGATASVVLTAVPDCSGATDLDQQTAQVSVTAVEDADLDDEVTGYYSADDARLAVWLGQQTALACS